MSKTGSELNAEFIDSVAKSQWKPVNPAPAPTRETLKRDLREFLVTQTGSETLADLSISHLTSEADARVRLEVELRADLVRVDASIERFNQDTLSILAPLEQRVRTAEAALASAAAALDAARSTRTSELARGLETRRVEILTKLRGVEVLQGRIIPWREGGEIPQFPPGT